MNPLTDFGLPLSRFVLISAILILLTSSFDIFLVVEAGGNYRFCQVLILPLVALALVKTARGRSTATLGLTPLLLWFAVQLCFVPITEFWAKSLGYCLWLLLNIGMYYAFVQLFSDTVTALATLLRWYAWSFALIAAFGVIQFGLPVLGFGAPLVKQWWIPELLPRANGFSYEPSYFATYLLIGFVFVSSLRRAGSSLLGPRSLLLICVLTATGIMLSSSRIGIVFLLIDIFLPSLKPFLSVLADLRLMRISPSKVRHLFPYLLAAAVVVSISAASLMAVERTPGVLLIFLNGTGLSDTAAHSVVERLSAFEDTLETFYEHPIIGCSLGGVSSRIAEIHSETVTSFEASNQFYPINVFAEVLAASGIVGVIPFVWFLIESIGRPLRLAKSASPALASILRALIRSLVYLWAMLQFNQNVLRAYLWVHLAIVATVVAAACKATAYEGRQLSKPQLDSTSGIPAPGMT